MSYANTEDATIPGKLSRDGVTVKTTRSKLPRIN